MPFCRESAFRLPFSAKGQFQGSTIRQVGNDYILEQKLEGPYFQPYPKDAIPADGDWEKMPKSNRRQSEVQALTSSVHVRETSIGVECDILITGTDGVPVSVELIFREGGVFSGVEALEMKKMRIC